MSRVWSIPLLAAVLLGGTSSFAEPVSGAEGRAEAPSEDELKERFRQRLGTLRSLKDAGTVGETTEGLVDVVRKASLGEDVTVDDERMTVREFLEAENADRRLLYQLIGGRTGEPVQVVAQQAAIRNFRHAGAQHYLKLRNDRWVQKKNLPTPPE